MQIQFSEQVYLPCPNAFAKHKILDSFDSCESIVLRVYRGIEAFLRGSLTEAKEQEPARINPALNYGKLIYKNKRASSKLKGNKSIQTYRKRIKGC